MKRPVKDIIRKAWRNGLAAPAEAELGAVLGHESGSLPSYDELFASGRGFTDPEEARQFGPRGISS